VIRSRIGGGALAGTLVLRVTSVSSTVAGGLAGEVFIGREDLGGWRIDQSQAQALGLKVLSGATIKHERGQGWRSVIVLHTTLRTGLRVALPTGLDGAALTDFMFLSPSPGIIS
jgi:hypothetical protein